MKTLTHKLQNGLMESKRNNRILQRKLDILEEKGNDPTNHYKLKKSVRDKILEERNKELREENEAFTVEIREAQTRVKELEEDLHQERINKVISPDAPEDIDEEKITKLVNEIDQMDDVERKEELKLLITHLQEQKRQIKDLEESQEDKDAKIEELESLNSKSKEKYQSSKPDKEDNDKKSAKSGDEFKTESMDEE